MTHHPPGHLALDDVLQAVQTRVSYIKAARCAPESEGWVCSETLIADPDRLGAEILATAEGRGTHNLTVAASLYAQAYSFRVASVAVAAWAIGLPVPSVAPHDVATRIARHRPAEVALVGGTVSATTASELVESLLDRHLLPFFAAIRATVHVGERLLLGNAAASLMTVFRAVQSSAGPLGDAAVRHRAADFMRAADTHFNGLGAFWSCAVPEAPDDRQAVGWFWERTNCCLWYRTSSAQRCDDCSLHDVDTLRADRCAQLISTVTTCANQNGDRT